MTINIFEYPLILEVIVAFFGECLGEKNWFFKEKLKGVHDKKNQKHFCKMENKFHNKNH